MTATLKTASQSPSFFLSVTVFTITVTTINQTFDDILEVSLAYLETGRVSGHKTILFTLR